MSLLADAGNSAYAALGKKLHMPISEQGYLSE